MTRDPQDGDARLADARLVEALSRLGEDHRADTARMWQRIETARIPGGGPPSQPTGAVPPRNAHRATGPGAAMPAPAARRLVAAGVTASAVLGLLLGANVLAGRGAGRPPAQLSASRAVPFSPAVTGPAADATPTPSTTLTPPGRPGITPRTSSTLSGTGGPTPAPGLQAASSVAPPPPPPVGVTATAPLTAPNPVTNPGGFPATHPPAAPAAAARLTVLRTATDRSVSLSTATVLDWVAVGQRRDIQQVRAKRPAGGTGMTVSTPFTAVWSPAPLSVSWVDGVPEQTRSGSTTWLSSAAGQPVRITVPPSGGARRLVVYLGGSNTSLAVDVSGRSRWSSSDWLLPMMGYALSVDLPASPAPVTVTVTGVTRGGFDPYLSVGAVTLSAA